MGLSLIKKGGDVTIWEETARASQKLAITKLFYVIFNIYSVNRRKKFSLWAENNSSSLIISRKKITGGESKI